MNTPVKKYEPLSSRVRPESLENFVGQTHLLAKGASLRNAIEQKTLHSMILWGPPGTGKTTLAKIIAENFNAAFIMISAVFSGVKDIRAIVDIAKENLEKNQRTILFVDEVHRFNKAQQDAFLPYVENGTLIFIGATTENPSFSINNALLSRARVYVLKTLSENDLKEIINSALRDKENGLGNLNLEMSDELKQQLAMAADGDARQALTLLEMVADFAETDGKKKIIKAEHLKSVLTAGTRKFDKQGDYFYDAISALHKSVRGSSPDAALYWLSVMLVSGCDPLYIARRVVRMASEDIGNADPRALTIALDAWEVQERVGSPEGEIALAQAVVYLACAAKSNAVYTAFNKAWDDAKELGTLEVPIHLRNAPTKLMKNLGFGKDYRYPFDEKEAYIPNENYFPEKMKPRKYYYPSDRGLEKQIQEKLAYLKSLDKVKIDD